jgi:hypothetical protein
MTHKQEITEFVNHVDAIAYEIKHGVHEITEDKWTHEQIFQMAIDIQRNMILAKQNDMIERITVRLPALD